MLREVVDFLIIPEDAVFRISKIRGDLDITQKQELEKKINSKILLGVYQDVSKISMTRVNEIFLTLVPGKRKTAEDVIMCAKPSSTIRKKGLSDISAIIDICDDYNIRGASEIKEYLLKAIMICKIETLSDSINRFAGGEYKIIVISPNKTNRIGDIAACFYIDKSYEWSEYNCKTIFALKNDASHTIPLKLGNDPVTPSKHYWYYNEKLYWENDGLDAGSVKALIDAKESKKQRKVEFLKGPDTKQTSRRFIDDDVKIAVWRRDNARCVKCGSNKDLEFDHIIPVSMGGSSTERNLQLLCERCNRGKGADLK